MLAREMLGTHVRKEGGPSLPIRTRLCSCLCTRMHRRRGDAPIASRQLCCRGARDRSGLANRLPAFGWSNFVHEGRQRSLCRVDAIPPLIRKQMHIYPAAGPKPRTYALLTEEAKPAAFACKRRGEAPIICLAQSNGLGYLSINTSAIRSNTTRS